jgi:hypothetical protein
MQVHIHTKTDTHITCQDLDGETTTHDQIFDLALNWHKITIPLQRMDITDIVIDSESIKHCINSGINTDKGYEIWLHGNLAEYFSRISKCIAHEDLMRFKNLKNKYLITESWNEKVEGDFIPNSVKNFFAKGEGPHWYSKTDFHNLPYVTYDGPGIDASIDLDEDLEYIDTKFYGQGRCKSLKQQPVLPTIKLEQIKNKKLQKTMQQFGFTDILQMQYVELQPNSVLPIHMDDFAYRDGKNIIDGPTQLYCVLSGDSKYIKFKFKNVGLIDVSKPIFINNCRFVHSLVYTGNEPRGVLLAYGVRQVK